MSDVYHPILTWGLCSHNWGHGRPCSSPADEGAPSPPRALGVVVFI